MRKEHAYLEHGGPLRGYTGCCVVGNNIDSSPPLPPSSFASVHPSIGDGTFVTDREQLPMGPRRGLCCSVLRRTNIQITALNDAWTKEATRNNEIEKESPHVSFATGTPNLRRYLGVLKRLSPLLIFYSMFEYGYGNPL